MIDIIVSKRCSTCSKVQELHLFPVDTSCKDGYKHSCKACLSERNRLRYKERKAEGKVRLRGRRPQPLWPVPTHDILQSLASVQLRKWRGPVEPGMLRGAL